MKLTKTVVPKIVYATRPGILTTVHRKVTGTYEFVTLCDSDKNDIHHLTMWLERLIGDFAEHRIEFDVAGTRTGWDQRTWRSDTMSIFVTFRNI